MVLTHKQRNPRDFNKFPTTQLFVLGEWTSQLDSGNNSNHLVALVRVAEPIALTSIFPYAWQLVKDFHFGDKSNASFYAGILISAFALAESITGM